MKKSVALIFICLISTNCFSQCDVDSSNFLDLLFSKDTILQQKALNYVKQNQESADPYTLMITSTVFFDRKKDSAIYWYYLGSVRGKYLASLYKNPSSSALYSALRYQFGMEVNSYVKEDPKKAARIINDVLIWDKDHPWNAKFFLESLDEEYIAEERWLSKYNAARNYFKKLSQQLIED